MMGMISGYGSVELERLRAALAEAWWRGFAEGQRTPLNKVVPESANPYTQIEIKVADR